MFRQNFESKLKTAPIFLKILRTKVFRDGWQPEAREFFSRTILNCIAATGGLVGVRVRVNGINYRTTTLCQSVCSDAMPPLTRALQAGSTFRRAPAVSAVTTGRHAALKATSPSVRVMAGDASVQKQEMLEEEHESSATDWKESAQLGERCLMAVI